MLLRRRGQEPEVAGQLSVVSCQLSGATDHWPLTTDHSHRSIVPGVAPGNPYLGVMLPYTPLHHLLLAALGRPIVCTSGNLSDEPMAIAIEDAQTRLGPIADLLLTHDRPIVRPVDDSIVRVGPEGPEVLRRTRGFAPRPIRLSRPSGPATTILAVGGHLKNTVALLLGDKKGRAGREGRVGEQRAPPREIPCRFRWGSLRPRPTLPFSPSPSFRRSECPRGRPGQRFERRGVSAGDRRSGGVFRATPEAMACDLHPDYASTQYAQRLAARWDVPLVRVQHHHAHVAACMAEHGLGGPVLGFSWDGTGYGPDGTVWGGEVLWCEGPQFRRLAHLRTFPLPGGDQAMHEPRRSALGLLFEMLGRDAAAEHVAAAGWFRPADWRVCSPCSKRRSIRPGPAAWAGF